MGKRRKKPKLPNGFGSIVTRKRNGKEETRVYGPAVYNPQTQQYYQEPLGIVNSYTDGYMLLLNYHNNPNEVKGKEITLGFVCEKAMEQAKKVFEKGSMSKSNLKNLNGANNKLQKNRIANTTLLELTKFELQDFLDGLDIGYTSKNYLINLFNRAFEYSLDYFKIKIDINTSKLDVGEKEKSDKFKVITDEDIQLIWDSKESIVRDIFLVSLYTGARPNEILKIETKNVFLEENYMIGGSKTEAGKDRVLPIHPDIKPIIERLYNLNNKYLFTSLRANCHISLKTYEEGFKSLMRALKIDYMGYLPYCTRHTFATKANECGFNEAILKIILGHSLRGDVTNHVYIHRKKELIINEIKKLNYRIGGTK